MSKKQRREKINTQNKAHRATKMVLVILCISLFSLSFVSSVWWNPFSWFGNHNAISFDPVELEYKNNNMTIDFKEGVDVIGSATLKSHSTYDEIRKVGTGNHVLVWYEFNNIDNSYENAIGNVTFIDMREYIANKTYLASVEFDKTDWKKAAMLNPDYLQPIERDYQIVYLENGKWINFTSKDLPEGNVIIGVKADISWGELIDVVPNFFEKDFDRHAIVLGSNSGFVSTRPTGDPLGDDISNLDSEVTAINDTSPATAVKVTEIGVWADTAGWTPHNVSIGLYTANATGPDTLVAGNITFNTTTVTDEWLYGTVDIDILPNTVYWITVGINNLGQNAQSNYMNPGSNYFFRYTADAFTPEWSGTTTNSINWAFYAVWAASSASAPSITLNAPADNYESVSNSVIFNCTANDDDGLIHNVTLMLDGVNNHTVSGTATNLSLEKAIILPYGNHTWRCNATNNDTTPISVNSSERTIIYVGANETSHTYNQTSVEGVSETFILNFTYNNTIFTTATANLVYNNTNYAGTLSGSGDNRIFTRSLTVPFGKFNNSFYWEVTLSGNDNYKFNSSAKTQNISTMVFGICNSTLTNAYINFTFKNETLSEESVTATFDGDFTYWIDDQTVNRTLSHVNATENLNYTFCFTPADKPINLLTEIQYDNSESQVRNFDSLFSLTNTTTEQTLFLLPTSEGQFVTFQVINFASQPLANINATVRKGTDNIEQDLTDSSGTVQFFLNPDTTYSFIFDRTGITSYTTSFAPSQTSYTITMGSPSNLTTFDFLRGITWDFFPSNHSLPNNTDVTFMLNMTSSFWTIDEWAFNITNASGFQLAVNSSTNNGGSLSSLVNTGNNTRIYMDSYYIITNNRTNISTYSWAVVATGDTSFSLLRFFNNLSLYMDSGLFGLDNFGRAMIVFIFMFLFVGIMSFKFGLRSPATIMGIIFGTVLFFETIGLMPDIPNILFGVEEGRYFLTFLTGILLISLIYREVGR